MNHLSSYQPGDTFGGFINLPKHDLEAPLSPPCRCAGGRGGEGLAGRTYSQLSTMAVALRGGLAGRIYSQLSTMAVALGGGSWEDLQSA